MSRLILVALVLGSITAVAAGCDKKKENTGLPPASKWQGSGEAGGGPEAGGTVDPHAGVDMGGGADPHAGVDMGGAGGGADPHAGVDMGGAGGGADPHAGMSMGGGTADPHAGMNMGGSAGGTAAPGKPVDPTHFLRGTISVSPKLKDKVKAGGALFISVKRPDPTTGEGVGMPLVVEKLTLDLAGVPFDLSEENAMTGPGTVELTGEVVITARYDQDADAFSKQPGDVTGKLKVTVPGKDLKLVLDTVQP